MIVLIFPKPIRAENCSYPKWGFLKVHKFCNIPPQKQESERGMSRTLRTILCVLLLSSCGATYSSAPRNMDNACSILSQRPTFHRAFQAAKRKWGVPVHVQMATIHQESKFIGNARTPMRYSLGIIPRGRQSSAYGYAQALDGTWREYQRATGRFGARRDDIRDASDFMGWYMKNSQKKIGLSMSDTRNQYLAYHEGQAGYQKGSHRRKSWLLNVADKVQTRSNMYKRQLESCGKS
jgi:hypothetical protein